MFPLFSFVLGFFAPSDDWLITCQQYYCFKEHWLSWTCAWPPQVQEVQRYTGPLPVSPLLLCRVPAPVWSPDSWTGGSQLLCGVPASVMGSQLLCGVLVPELGVPANSSLIKSALDAQGAACSLRAPSLSRHWKLELHQSASLSYFFPIYI